MSGMGITVDGILQDGSAGFYLSSMERQIAMPGDKGDYWLAKETFGVHPLGAKLAQAPVSKAWARGVKFTVEGVENAAPAVRAMERAWDELAATEACKYLFTAARVYGTAVMGVKAYYDGPEGRREIPTDRPLSISEAQGANINFAVYDPQVFSGKLILLKETTAPDFMQFPKYLDCAAMGGRFHPFRWAAAQNGAPNYQYWNPASYSYGATSCYSPAWFALKAYMKLLSACAATADKAAVLQYSDVQADASPSEEAGFAKRLKGMLAKRARSGDVMVMGKGDVLEAIDMHTVGQNLREVKDIIYQAICAAEDAPISLFSGDAQASGLSEGSEDGDRICEYVLAKQEWMLPVIRKCVFPVVLMRALKDDVIEEMSKDRGDGLEGETLRTAVMKAAEVSFNDPRAPVGSRKTVLERDGVQTSINLLKALTPLVKDDAPARRRLLDEFLAKADSAGILPGAASD